VLLLSCQHLLTLLPLADAPIGAATKALTATLTHELLRDACLARGIRFFVETTDAPATAAAPLLISHSATAPVNSVHVPHLQSAERDLVAWVRAHTADQSLYLPLLLANVFVLRPPVLQAVGAYVSA